MSEPAPLLVARGLSIRRGGRIVVENVSLSIESGRSYLLRGANGAGKTSLLRTLAGLSAPLSGRVESAERCAAYLGHSDGVKGALTARGNIAFWRALYAAEEPTDAIARLDLAGILDRRATALSAGQRRRLALCRITLSGRPLWLLDEPTAGMDAESSAAVIDLLTDHCRDGGAAVVATHEALALSEAMTFTLAPPQ